MQYGVVYLILIFSVKISDMVCEHIRHFGLYMVMQPNRQITHWHGYKSCLQQDAMAQAYKRIGYYTNWSQYRPSPMNFLPEDVDPFLFTHIIFSFAYISENSIVPIEWNDEEMYRRLIDHKKINPQLKILLAIGGWNFDLTKMTSMLSTKVNRTHFVRTAIEYLRCRGFDGLDLDFEYPGSRGSPPEDKHRFTLLVQELREAFDAENMGPNRLLLSAAVGCGKATIDSGYEIEEISRDLDWIGLMCYDLAGAWDNVTGFHSPLCGAGERTVEWCSGYWESQGAPRHKLVIGLTAYGRGFTLQNAVHNSISAPTTEGSPPGQYTREKGYLSYYEICSYLKSGGKEFWSEAYQVPYLLKDNIWVGYDNIESVSKKVQWLKSKSYAGFMVWCLDLDDFRGSVCGQGPYPLIKAMNSALTS